MSEEEAGECDEDEDENEQEGENETEDEDEDCGSGQILPGICGTSAPWAGGALLIGLVAVGARRR